MIGVENTTDNFEMQYAKALSNCYFNGIRAKNRTGIDTLVIQHQYFYLENIKDNFPMIKGKTVYPKNALIELMWMLNGFTDIKWLKERGVNYWDKWQDSNGTIGKSYGYQFRNFNGKDIFIDLIKEITRNPTSRRLIMNLWNHNDIDAMSLPPCFYDFHFECTEFNTEGIFDNMYTPYFVDLHVKQRSADSFIGTPYDFMFLAFLLRFVTKLANIFGEKNGFKYCTRDIHYTCDNFHIYTNHYEQVKQYLDNVDENKNNIINKKTALDIEFDYSFGKHTTLKSKIDGLLKCFDDFSYSMFDLDFIDFKEEDIYPFIKAEVAV